MKRLINAAAMSLCVVSLAAISSADTLIMRDGTRVQGTVVGIAGRTIPFGTPMACRVGTQPVGSKRWKTSRGSARTRAL
jgi:hypothetical protein